MRPSRQLLNSVAVQALGAAATFAIGIAIALSQGPQAQGRYGLVRTAADLLLALALFGLPQSMVHALNQRGASAAALERWSGRYAGLLMGLALLACAALALRPAAGGEAGLLTHPLALLALLAGTVGWVLQGLQRGFVLCRGSALQFAWLSVTPALSLLLAVAVLIALGSQRYEAALAASGLASAALGAWQLRPLRSQARWRAGISPPLAELFGSGTHAFAQSAALALQPWLTLWLLRAHGAGVAELGHFVFAAYVVQAFALPASFVAPLLFARISQAQGAGGTYAVWSRIRVTLLATTAAAVLAALLLPAAVPRLFGPAYAPTVAACVWLALSGPLVVLNRLGVSVLLGRGLFRAAGWHALARALLLPAVLLPCLQAGWVAPVTGAALAWALVEFLCAGVLLAAWWSAKAASAVAEPASGQSGP